MKQEEISLASPTNQGMLPFIRFTSDRQAAAYTHQRTLSEPSQEVRRLAGNELDFLKQTSFLCPRRWQSTRWRTNSWSQLRFLARDCKYRPWISQARAFPLKTRPRRGRGFKRWRTMSMAKRCSRPLFSEKARVQ